ncbi:glioma pathogenesis-related protein 1-like [Trichosurus vulpecula]|uniref:glioma pathogenesis-related protein 1-like n=1 Tax=Trichosurus vulpecula TaxID=9337 RepID=UPI00186AFCB3|nr:glioma pathogenesis-related protein 1-like [Trichosurus vulpecula]
MAMDSWLGVMILSVFSICNWAYKMDNLPSINNEDFIKECVELHNNFRSQVAPKASNMLRMSWDAGLAKVAETWAKRCEFKHNVDLSKPRRLHRNFSFVGENLWVGSLGGFSEKSAIKLWNDEVQYYNFQSLKCTHVCGHYTQVVWADSYKVGCAVQYCPELKETRIRSGALFVCNYGPAGNYYQTRPYQEGEPCSACKKDKCVDRLCVNPKRDGVTDKPHHISPWDLPKPYGEETDTRERSVSLILILVPFFIVLSVILAILIKHYYPR